MSGGVRNLRAMFENKDLSTSPPDRGRSPADSAGPGSNGTSPRPLSKVRTSFVAVERSGQLGSQMGLRRENSGEPSMARRRTSFSIDEEENPKIIAERKQSIASEFEARKNSSVIEETIPEVAMETPSIEVDKQLGGEIKPKTLTDGLEVKKAAATNAAVHTNGSHKTATTEKTVDKPSSSKFSARPNPISTAKTSAPSKPSPKNIKSPTAPKVPKTPTTPRGRPKELAQPAESKLEQKEKQEKKSTTSSHASKPVTRTTGPTAFSSASKTRIPPSPPQTGFVKPKPRSPTRPIKLPASLIAHTASSGSKGAAAPATTLRRSLSRASGNSQATNPLKTHPTLSRSPSRVSAATAPKTLSHKPSTLNKSHSRPSLGPPPSQLKKQPSRQSLPHAPADEGFLARMMRPTTSSASKTLEKTPPKKVPSSHRNGTSSNSEVSKAVSGVSNVPKMGELVAKPAKESQSSSAPAKAKESKPAFKKIPLSPGSLPNGGPPKPAAGAPTLEKTVANSTATKNETSATLVPEKVEEPTPTSAEDSKLEVPETSATDEEASGKEISSQKDEAEQPGMEESKTVEPEITSAAKPAPVILGKVPEIESTLDKPAPVEDKLASLQKHAEKKEAAGVIEKPAVLSKTEDIEAVKEAIAESKSEPNHVPIKAIEVPIPKAVELAEDPEDVKAREEIAKLNGEIMKAGGGDDDVE